MKQNNHLSKTTVLILTCLSFLALPIAAQKKQLSTLTKSIQKIQSKQTARPADPALAKDWDLFQFKMKKIRFLLKYYKPTPPLLEMVDEELKLVNKLMQALETKSPTLAEVGILEEAYSDQIDGSVQPFITYLPKNYVKNKKIPLIVYLHGYSPYLNIVNWSQIPGGLTELAEEINGAVTMPFARSNTDFQGIGEKDVINVIKQMQKRYNIDENKIFLAGMSMGGMGVWTIGSHYPHLFAGLIILSGRGDFYFWHKISPKTMPKHQRYLIDKEFAVSHLSNLKMIPTWVFHGDADTLIPVTEARHMNSLLKSKNTAFNYHEIPGGDHWIYRKAFNNEKLKEWIKQASRKNPESFSFTSLHPLYNQAYWLFISEYEENEKPATIQVKTKDGKISIGTSGIKELILDRNKMPKEISKFEIIKKNDFNLKEFPDYKNHRLPYPWGSIKDAFLEPFMFVNSGIKDLDIQQRVLEWYKFAKTIPRLKTEKDLTESDKKNFNLFLFGEPETSPLIKEVLSNTPIEVTTTEYIIGENKYPRKENGLYFKYKSPWNPAKSVVIQCGVPWGANCSENHRYDFLPGYIIYSKNAAPGDPFGSNKALEGGFFDKKGKIRH